MKRLILLHTACVLLFAPVLVEYVYGCEWDKIDPSPASGTLWGVYAPAHDDVFVVGFNGTAYRYNGWTWSSMYTGITRHLMEIWGNSDVDIFAVGTLGTIIHFNGIAWSTMTAPAVTSLTSIWGFSPADVYVCGYSDTLLHYNGSIWSNMTPGTGKDFLAIWGTSGNDLYTCMVYSSFTDIYNYIYHYDGADWTEMWNAHNEGGPANIWGTSSTNIYAVGSKSLHYDGVTWNRLAELDSYDTVWGTSETDIYAVGSKISHYEGISWTILITPDSDMKDVWVADECDVTCAGNSGNIYRCTCPVPSTGKTGCIILSIAVTLLIICSKHRTMHY